MRDFQNAHSCAFMFFFFFFCPKGSLFAYFKVGLSGYTNPAGSRLIFCLLRDRWILTFNSLFFIYLYQVERRYIWLLSRQPLWWMSLLPEVQDYSMHIPQTCGPHLEGGLYFINGKRVLWQGNKMRKKQHSPETSIFFHI